jgi:putative ABC transport system permease protein
VATTVGLALRGRRREFALLRTIGATRRQVRRVVSVEVLVVAAVAAPLGALPGLLLGDRMVPLLADAGIVGPGFVPTISPLPVLAASAVLVPTALLTGFLAARAMVRLPPLDAVRGSAVEDTGIGRTRRLLALLLTIVGLGAAFTPLVVPGTVGGASAASSALFLVAAAALAGPLLVAAAFRHTARLLANRRDAAVLLALANVRGFSRRLISVVVPLALLLAIGTVQTSVDRAVATASGRQLGSALGSDLVARAPAGLSPEQVARLAAVPGVKGAVALATLPARVRTDTGVPDALGWEATRLQVVPADAPASMFDPGVVRGSLRRLATPDRVAISSDVAVELGIGLGDSVDLRYAAGEHPARVVAVFDRGLGLGGYLVGPATLAAHGVDARPTTVLLDAERGTPARSLIRQAGGSGVTVTATDRYVASATSIDAATQHLSTVLLLMLLALVGLGASASIALSTAARRPELLLLHRIGSRRRQLLRMVAVESLLTAATAWLIGILAVVPAVLGVTFGLLGPAVPSVDWAMVATLSGVVLVMATGTTLLVARRAVPTRGSSSAGQ